jgi:hypothetical protein
MSADKEIKKIKFEFLLKKIVAQKKKFYIQQVDQEVDEITVKEAIETFKKVMQ